MLQLLETYADSGFIEQLTALSPAVGAGFIVGVIVSIVGWAAGLVIGMSKLEL